jgi:hypothetical protein
MNCGGYLFRSSLMNEKVLSQAFGRPSAENFQCLFGGNHFMTAQVHYSDKNLEGKKRLLLKRNGYIANSPSGAELITMNSP